MLFNCKPQRIRRSCYEFLQRVALWKSHQVRICTPPLIEYRPLCCNLRMCLPLPLAVIEVVEVREKFGAHFALLSYCRSSIPAALHRAGVDDRWSPKSCDPLRRLACLSKSKIGQFDIGAAPKS